MTLDVQYTVDVVHLLPFAFICRDRDEEYTYFAMGWLGLYIFIYKNRET